MKSRSESLRPETITAIKLETAIFMAVAETHGALGESLFETLSAQDSTEYKFRAILTVKKQYSQVSLADLFFAYPYHSWERGTNENVNGLIRREYPKRSSFSGIDGYQLWQLRRFVNDRPRECLGWNTPSEEMAAFLGFAP